MKFIKFFLIVLILFNFNLAKAENENLKNEITKNLRCLVCQGQSIYDSDSEFANSLKIRVTPTFIIGKQILPGAYDYEKLKKIILENS